MVVDTPLSPNRLQEINRIHQSFYTYLTYSVHRPGNIEEYFFKIHSFYRRLFDLVVMNDFEATNSRVYQKSNTAFEENGSKLVALALFELAQFHKKLVPFPQ